MTRGRFCSRRKSYSITGSNTGELREEFQASRKLEKSRKRIGLAKFMVNL